MQRQHRNQNRIDGIDLLRGISILTVLFTHIDQSLPIEHSFIGRLPWPIFSGIFRSGYLGVVMFFVISGFLITSISMNRWENLKDISPKKFYVIRFARIAPNLIALLIVLSGFHFLRIKGFVIDTDKVSLFRAIFSALTFHINWLQVIAVGSLPLAWSILWSLSIEEVFYFVFPILWKLVKKENIVKYLLFSLIILGPFARTILSNNQAWRDHSYLSGMDGIAIGCLVALFSRRVKISKVQTSLALLLGTSIVIVSLFFKREISRLGLTDAGLNISLLIFGTGVLVLGLSEKFKMGLGKGAWVTAPIRWYGRSSYEIYLTHLFVIIPLASYLNGSSFVLVGIMTMLGLTGLLGWLITKYYAELMNKMIRLKFSGSITADEKTV